MADEQLSLFDSKDVKLENDLKRYFDQWLEARQASARPYRQSSIDVYAAMWHSISEFFILRERDPLRASTAEITTMLLHVGGSIAYQKRLLILLEDITQKAANEGFISPVREILREARYRFADTRSTDKVPLTLNQIQEHELVKRLTTGIKDGSWKRQRDTAMAATILSSGIKPGEALTLLTEHLRFAGLNSTSGDSPEKLSLPGNGNNGPRECPIAAWGRDILGQWLKTRHRLNIRTKHLFPGSLTIDRPIGKATLYRQFGALLCELDITTPKQGTHLLRHTFAVRQLEQGKRHRAVQDWLGLEDSMSMSIYERIARK